MLVNRQLRRPGDREQARSYSTSGASETIFMNFSLRSSRVTGPKMRVPIGSSLLLSSTAALPSKRISEPSGRRTPLAERTTTALKTSPFLTLPRNRFLDGDLDDVADGR